MQIPKIEYFEDVTLDPFTMDSVLFGDVEDIFSIFQRAQVEGGGVHARSMLEILGGPMHNVVSEMPQYSVISFGAVETVLRNPKIFSNRINKDFLGATCGDITPTMDPPAHTYLRKQIEPLFMPSQIRQWATDIVDPVINDLIGKFIDKGEAELIEQFALPYPFEIIYRQLEMPPEDARLFHRLAVTLTWTGDGLKYGVEAGRKLDKYFKALLALRREQPGGDLVSLLSGRPGRDPELLPDKSIIDFLKLLINAAGDTTYRTTGSVLIGLLTNPDQLEAVRQDRSLVPRVLEEGLRWNGPFISSFRETTEDTELEGVKIPKGAFVYVGLVAANNDPARFENPRQFNIFRGTKNHVGFGMGPHMCLGQHLARLEMTRALNAILDRLPNLRLDPSKPPPKISGATMRTPNGLHVLFG